MRFDLSGVANGLTGGIGHGEIDLLGAILRHAHDQMRWQGDVAEAFSRTCPSARGMQPVAAIVLGSGIAQLLSRNNGLARQDHGAEFARIRRR